MEQQEVEQEAWQDRVSTNSEAAVPVTRTRSRAMPPITTRNTSSGTGWRNKWKSPEDTGNTPKERSIFLTEMKYL